MHHFSKSSYSLKNITANLELQKFKNLNLSSTYLSYLQPRYQGSLPISPRLLEKKNSHYPTCRWPCQICNQRPLGAFPGKKTSKRQATLWLVQRIQKPRCWLVQIKYGKQWKRMQCQCEAALLQLSFAWLWPVPPRRRPITPGITNRWHQWHKWNQWVIKR